MAYLALLRPFPMPLLFAQIGLVAVWLLLVGFSVRRWGVKGLWALLTAPLFALLWIAIALIVLVVACASFGSCV